MLEFRNSKICKFNFKASKALVVILIKISKLTYLPSLFDNKLFLRAFNNIIIINSSEIWRKVAIWSWYI